MQSSGKEHQSGVKLLCPDIANDAADNTNNRRHNQNISLAELCEQLGRKSHDDDCYQNGNNSDQRIHIRIAENISGEINSGGQEDAVDDEGGDKYRT